MTKEGRKHSKLFYWVGVPVLSIIGLLILGFLALFLYYFFAGTNYTYIHSNEIPMYGFTSYEQYKNGRTDAIAKVDDDFVNEVLSLSNGDKRNASNHACNRGFEYFNNNDAKTAIKRFNQGWLLDHENPCIFAGYGYMYGKYEEYENATAMYERAIELTNQDKEYFWVYVDYSEIMLQCYHFSKERIDCLNKAEENLNKATAISDEPKVHRSLAFLYYEKGEYEKTWVEVHKALDGGISEKKLGSGFMKALREKMADPLA